MIEQNLTLSLEQTIERFDLKKLKPETLAQYLCRRKKNRVGVPLTLDFHYTKTIGGTRIHPSNFDKWLACDISQIQDIANWQKKMRKVS